MMNKIIALIGLSLLIYGCGSGESQPRDTSSPARALIGRWKDQKVWGWREYFTADNRFFITVNRDIFYRGSYDILVQDRDERSLKLFMEGSGTSAGARMFLQGFFSADFSVFSGTLSQSSGGGRFSEPSPVSWGYLDGTQEP